MDKDIVTGDIEEEGEFLGDLIELTDEDGVKHSFELVDTLEHKGCTYVALVTAPESPEELIDGDGSLVIMKIVSEDGEDEILEMIEDEDEFDEISEMFMDRLSDVYDFEDEDDECSCGCGCGDQDESCSCGCGHDEKDDDDEKDGDKGCSCGCKH
ncbi:MAG: DUF1292 domain-containing protein [Oscillospiraceae bacterium]